ncbi:undecaprenyl diphosphate synthase family protein [Candidatus Leptofilum sp.]|uniref:undecaprenyl diphosphate synthase family protein n=1 Tax=Candidatus Leptofilum sp. TaxID=3241576 RepID=UPI003B58D847
MEIDKFLALETVEIAQLMQSTGPKVCALIFNGTRRWFVLEHAKNSGQLTSKYIEETSKRLIEICKMLFEHGIDTLVLPMLNSHIMKRGEQYLQVAASALKQVATHSRYLDFYKDYQVRARFYGQYHECLATTSHAHLSHLFDQLTEKTLNHTQYRIFWGICADDAIEAITQMAIDYASKHAIVPNKEKLIELYYGEPIPEIDLFLNSGKPHVSDVPLISLYKESLYFSVAPLPYLNQRQLRLILHDLLFARNYHEGGYEKLTEEKLNTLHKFYHLNLENTLGVGVHNTEWGVWHPTPQLFLLDDA